MFSLFLIVLSSAIFSWAGPILRRDSGVSPLSSSQVDSFTPFTHFAGAAYCPASQTASWQCGAQCQANADFRPTSSGGDGANVQFWYVGFSPSLGSVIVAHQGTSPQRIIPLFTNAELDLQDIDSTLFPGVPSGTRIHSGFGEEYAKIAHDVLDAVNKTLASNNVKTVTVIGHSLGGALALLDSLFLHLHLPGISIKTIGYGLPRVGNKVFADFVDAQLSVTRINNKKDPVPTLPGDFLGYVHPNGEIHITESGAFESCPGHDNTDALCTAGDVPNVFKGNVGDHHGPYNGVTIRC